MISSSDQADSQEPKHANRYSPVPLTADSDPHGNGHGWLLRVSSDLRREVVPEEGIEPSRDYSQGILSHINIFIINN
jgi:hypothetical protein